LVVGEKGTYRALEGEPVSFVPKKGLSNSIVVQALADTVDLEMKRIAEKEFKNLHIETRVSILGHVQRQPETLSQSDVRLGLDVGVRAGLAVFEQNFGMMVPRLPGSLISLAYAVSDEAQQESEARVRAIWKRHFSI
jgi:6-phosphofructokinase